MNSQDFFARFTASPALTAGWCPVGTAATPCQKANGTVAEINRQSPSRPRRSPINHKIVITAASQRHHPAGAIVAVMDFPGIGERFR